MAEPLRGEPPATPPSLADIALLPPHAPELDRPLPQGVTDAHLRYLETGEGQAWGGFFS
ncbi:MAG: hypothetical protein SFV15_16655 [Polyangiaceae bacterium]|nr:hypothetical protein [Polyangiaceae bacterium]